jgi:hypothetical protein
LTALNHLNDENNLDRSGFTSFNSKLDEFLIHKQLVVKLFQPLQLVASIVNLVVNNIDNRLLILNDGLSTLEKKIEITAPHIIIMKKVARNLAIFAKNTKHQCIDLVEAKYKQYFTQISSKITIDFPMPVPSELGEMKEITTENCLKKKIG